MFDRHNARELIQTGLQLGLVLGAIVIIFRFLDLELLQSWVQRAGVWAPVLFFALIVASQIVAPISGGSVMTIGALLLGGPAAFVVSYAGVLVGCSVNFWIARRFGRRLVTRFVGEKSLDKLDVYLKKNTTMGWSVLLVITILTADIAGYMIGLTSLKYYRFLGMLAFTAAITIGIYIFVGTNLVEWLIRQGG